MSISKCRKSSSRKIKYKDVVPNLEEQIAFSFVQWAIAKRWLHADGEYIYETNRTMWMTIPEILQMVNIIEK